MLRANFLLNQRPIKVLLPRPFGDTGAGQAAISNVSRRSLGKNRFAYGISSQLSLESTTEFFAVMSRDVSDTGCWGGCNSSRQQAWNAMVPIVEEST